MPYLNLLNYDPKVTKLPSGWNIMDKCTSLEVSSDRYVVEYTVSGREGTEAAAVRSDFPIPLNIGVYYYEVQILSRGVSGYMGIGLCGPDVSLVRLPGWNANSFGYHGDDGNLFVGSGVGTIYGPTYNTGDVVGCCLNTLTGELFYTLNGIALKIATTILLYGPPSSATDSQRPAESQIFYPCVGMRSMGEKLAANFGQNSFRYDISSYILEQKQKVYEKVFKEAYQRSPFSRQQIEAILLDYFLKQALELTAFSFQKSISVSKKEFNLDNDPVFAAQWQSMKERRDLALRIRKGEVSAVLDHLNSTYPDFLLSLSLVHLQLKIQQFIEQILSQSNRSTETMFLRLAASKELAIFQSPADRNQPKEMQEFLYLLSYEDPTKSPFKSLLEQQHRDHVADAFQIAMAKYQGMSPLTSLEITYRQLLVTLEQLALEGLPYLAFIDIQRDFFDRDKTPVEIKFSENMIRS